MAEVNNTSRSGIPRSSIPRPSRLPVPLQSLRPVASRESLRALPSSIQAPRLRPAASTSQLNSYSQPANAASRPPVTLNTARPSTLRTKPSNAGLNRSFDGPSAAHTQYEEENETSPQDLGGFEEALLPKPAPRKPRPSLSERTLETLSNVAASPAVNRRTSNFFNPDSPMRPPSQATNSRPSTRGNDASMGPPSRPISRAAGSRPGSSLGRPGSSLGRPGSSLGQNHAIPIDFRASTNTFLPPRTSSIQTPAKRPSTANTLRTPKSVSNTRLAASATQQVLKKSGQAPAAPHNTPAQSTYLKAGSRTIGRSIRPRASINGLFDDASAPQQPTPSRSKTLGRPAAPRPSISGLFDVSALVGSSLPSTPSGQRSPKPRASIGHLAKKASVSHLSQSIKKPLTSARKVSAATSNASTASTSATSQTSKDSVSTAESSPSIKSSSALRDHIAKAKAAKRAEMMKQAAASRPSQYDEAPVVPTDSFDFGLDDPFNQKGDPQKGLLRKRIDAARTDGRLNIAAMGLKAIPAEVMGMYNLDNINGTAGSWAESVDLTRFIAADNELESLGDDVFPDVNAQDLADNDDGQSNIFGGLETLDLHGNLLSSIPMGLRQLALLSTLNLSNNKLDNVAFGVISQMTGLRDLKIANNQLTGELDPGLLRLIDLEVLDLHNNQLSSLPSGISELSRLRILNLSQNSFTSLPFDELQQLPLVEFSAAKNKLSGVLINLPSVTLPRLEEFDVSVNSLTALSSGTLELPACKQIILLANRLKELPDMSSWTSLITLSVSDNGLTALPEGFTSMSKLRIADFQGNDIRLLDDRIALMESLETLIVAGNPLREKKFAGMSTADLKKNLLARLEPEPETEPEVEDQPAGTLSTMDNRESWHSAKSDATEYLDAPSTPTLPRSPSAAEWSINTAQGILDRSHSQSSTLNPLVVAQIASENRIINVQLHHNAFAEIPSSVAFFGLTLTTLNLSHNSLSSDTWIREEIELPVLKELNVSSNTFNSLSPLVKSLKAPALEKLDISFNRVSSLPSLRPNFPQLSYLLASNNQIRELAAETVNGMRVVDCSSNELERLDPRLGLCKGLERLEVSGNRFRVPKYTVLEKGTEAVLAWLRDRLPPEEVAALGAEEVF